MSAERYAASVLAAGLQPDHPDIQDWEWQDMPWLWLPQHYENRHFLLGIEAQANNDCVANAGTTVLEGIECAVTGQRTQRSRRHLYWHARNQSDSTRGVDGGTTLRDAIKAMYHVGVATEAAYPYTAESLNVEPPQSVDDGAADSKVTEYRRLKGITSQDALLTIRRMREAIATGHILLFASELEAEYFGLTGSGPHLGYMGCAKPGAQRGYFHAEGVSGYCLQGSMDWGRKIGSWDDEFAEDGTARVRLTVLANDATDIWALRTFRGLDVVAMHARRKKIAQLYVALFGRAPDGAGPQSGFSFWHGQLVAGYSVAQIADWMFATAPARLIYPSGLSHEQIVTAFYNNVLGRAPDSGLAFWRAKMDAFGVGATIGELISTVETFAGTDPAGAISAQRFANLVGRAQLYAERGGDAAGAYDALTEDVF